MNDIAKYPHTLVPNSVMHHAHNIHQIRDRISYEIVSAVDCCDIFQQYRDDTTLISLGFCRMTMSGTIGRIKSFHTANLVGVDYLEKMDNHIYYRAHVLESPIKHLGKELFGQAIEVFQHAGVEEVSITPFEFTGSQKFYHKMIHIYADRLIDALIYPNNDIILTLKKP